MTTAATATADSVLRIVEHHHAQCVKDLRGMDEVVSPPVLTSSSPHGATGAKMERSASHDTVPSTGTPMVRAVNFHAEAPRTGAVSSDLISVQSGSSKRARRLTAELADQRRLVGHSLGKSGGSFPVFDSDLDSEDDIEPFQLGNLSQSHVARRLSEDVNLCVQQTLCTATYSSDGLVKHLRSLDVEKKATITALHDLWEERGELDAEDVVLDLETHEEAHEDHPNANTHHASYEVYDILSNGQVRESEARSGAAAGDAQGAAKLWESISSINPNEDAVGRMTFLQEPSPIMLGAAHMTMKKYFDMDELFQHLVTTEGNKGLTKAYMHRAFEKDELHRRTFFFVFKYYTIVATGSAPAPWQRHDDRPPEKKSLDHIDITECGSVLALSLEVDGKGKEVQGRSRRTKRNAMKDDEHTLWLDEDHSRRYINGPYAFISALAAEYRDAVKRYAKLNERITALITPPREFMFNVKLRDKLLFEDKNFTYSRRYFWAYNTLGVINDGIKAMMSALAVFDNDFWSGQHQTLWPHPRPNSTDARNYENAMSVLRHELERAVKELRHVHDKNERTQTEIRSLREQLFSGSSVKESRRALEQGDNIKVLTGVSMLFLPLTFVTGVFGITTFDISADNWRFPVTMISVCVPFFILILILQTRKGMDIFKKCGEFVNKTVEHYLTKEGRRQHMHQQGQHQHHHGQHHHHHHPVAARREKLKRSQSGLGGGKSSIPDQINPQKPPWWTLGHKRKQADDVEGARGMNQR